MGSLIPRTALWERVLRMVKSTWRGSLPVAALALSGCQCPGPGDRIYLIREPEPELAALIEACEDPSRQDCLPLCTHLMATYRSRGDYTRGVAHCQLHPRRDGYHLVHVGWYQDCPGGRRPEGFSVHCEPTGSAAGAWWAQMAALEAASVPAFQRLGDELRAHGAPSVLAEACVQAAAEERRHAFMTQELARRHGSETLPWTSQALTPMRDLETIAVENAVEGCVRETYGALLAAYQALSCPDPVVRRATATIAREEASHAALSLAIDAWGQDRLSPAARRRLADARSEAAASLMERLEEEGPGDLVEGIGLPHAPAARLLATAVAERLWL